MSKNKSLYDPGIVVWEITLQCNLKCLHCGSSAGQNRSDELSTEEALKLCKDLKEIGFKGIALMGGELFLRKDWKQIAKEIKMQGMKLSIITNGFFKPNKLIGDLVKLETDCLMVGMDGGTAKIQDAIRNVKGSYKTAWTFIKASKKAGLPIGIITTIHKKNLNELPKIRKKVLAEEIDWQIQPAGLIGRFPKDLLLDEKEHYSLAQFISSTQKKHANNSFSITGSHNFGFHSKNFPPLSMYPDWEGCYAGKSVLGIQSNGNVKGCLGMPDYFIEGNIRKRDIKDIWNDPNSFSYNRNFNEKDIGNNCKNCDYLKTCKGGCTASSYSLTGIAHNDPFCFYRYELNQKK